MAVFPNAAAQPRGLPNVERAIQQMQAAPCIVVPTVTSLPANPVLNQLVVHSNLLKRWNGSAWKTVTET